MCLPRARRTTRLLSPSPINRPSSHRSNRPRPDTLQTGRQRSPSRSTDNESLGFPESPEGPDKIEQLGPTAVRDSRSALTIEKGETKLVGLVVVAPGEGQTDKQGRSRLVSRMIYETLIHMHTERTVFAKLTTSLWRPRWSPVLDLSLHSTPS